MLKAQMKRTSNRAAPIFRSRRSRSRSTRFVALVVACIAWTGEVRADDVLERHVHVDIVAALQTRDLRVQDALDQLLRGSGLSFSRVGAATVAIRFHATAPAPLEAVSVMAPARPSTDSSALPPALLPDVAVIGRRPLSAELAYWAKSAGYNVEVRGGKIVYCKDFVRLGSRIPHTGCVEESTLEQIWVASDGVSSIET